MIRDCVSAALMLAGMIFLLLSAVGVLRLPDFYMRLQAAAKASTLGLVCTILAASVWFPTAWVFSRSILIVAFVFLTAPVAAHIIGRLAYITKVPLWQQTIVDEFGQQHARRQKTARFNRRENSK
jgi:multicomponent Na+:H+ antiporter subunit G